LTHLGETESGSSYYAFSIDKTPLVFANRILTATFTLPAGSNIKVPAIDASVRVALKATPATKANCTVTEVAPPAITVVCPDDAGIPAGSDVILE
jgi:hypothetical protein